MGNHREGSLGGFGGVLLAQGTGCRVARVDEGLFPGLDAGFVEGGEVGDREVDLTAHLDSRGNCSVQGLRDRGDGSRVGGDVLADVAVASGGGAHEATVLVEEINRKAVDFDFGRHLEVRDAGRLGHAGLPPDELLEGEDVVEGHHLGEVAYLGETGVDAAAHAHRGRVGSAQLRVALLNLLNLAVHAVVVCVREGRRIPVVVGGAGLVDLQRANSVQISKVISTKSQISSYCFKELPYAFGNSPLLSAANLQNRASSCNLRRLGKLLKSFSRLPANTQLCNRTEKRL